MFLYSFLLIAIFSKLSLASYDSSDDVIVLTTSNFNQMKTSDELWFVEFYAPWCGHCKNLEPEWKKAASALKGVVKVAAVDMDQHGDLGRPYNIRGFPTIKVFGKNKDSPTDFHGERTAQSIVNAALKEVEQLVRSRTDKTGSKQERNGEKSDSGNNVIELTDSNFSDLVLASDEPWLVEFFAPWCGHCKSLKPEWEQAANDLKGKVKLGAVDATVHTELARRFGIQGYPTIKFFPAGVKTGESKEYDGGRKADDIVSWANDKVQDSVPLPEVREITGQSVLTTACEGHQLCVVAVLPHILDCQSECRHNYIRIIRDAAHKYKTNRWGWLWTEAMKHPSIESAFSIGGFGYPAMVVVNTRKQKLATLTGPFSDTGVQEFVRDVTLGRGTTGLIQGEGGLPEVTEVAAWDGKDGEVPHEEEIDLSELGLDPIRSDL